MTATADVAVPHCRSEHLDQDIGDKGEQQGYGNEDEYLFVL